MKICKTFYEAQNFITEIYRNIQAVVFKVIQECSSWESRNGAV